MNLIFYRIKNSLLKPPYNPYRKDTLSFSYIIKYKFNIKLA